jgi:hypothetical protein
MSLHQNPDYLSAVAAERRCGAERARTARAVRMATRRHHQPGASFWMPSHTLRLHAHLLRQAAHT